MNTTAVVIYLVLSVIVIYGVYRLIHRFLPGWGTILTNLLMGVVGLIEALQLLPWNLILDDKQVGFVMFIMAAVNGLMRITPSKVDHPL